MLSHAHFIPPQATTATPSRHTKNAASQPPRHNHHATTAMQADMVEHVARLAWSAALPFMRKPLLRAALVRPLSGLVAVTNQLGVADRKFQVPLGPRAGGRVF